MSHELRDEIIRLHTNGVPCSRIDWKLRLTTGTAHNVIVGEWQFGRHGGKPLKVKT